MPFRVDVDRLFRELLKIAPRLCKNKFSRLLQIAVEVNCADQRFEGVGQGRCSGATAACFFAASHQKESSQVQSRGVFFQRFLRNQSRPQFRQLPFRLVAEMPKKMFGDNELKNGVAQKFKTLIVEMMLLCLVTETGMSQRLSQQKWIPEFVADSFFEWMHVTAFDKSRAR